MTMHTFTPTGTNLRPRLERNDRGRDLVVAGVHGHFATLRRALAELEVNEHDRVFSLENLVDGGPRSFDALNWIAGRDPSMRFHAALRGNHEQMMLEALLVGPPDAHGRTQPGVGADAWRRWMAHGGGWWIANGRHHDAPVWVDILARLPLCATIETAHGPVGLVHASPVWPSWDELEATLVGDEDENHFTRKQALWSAARLDLVERHLGRGGDVHLGPVAGVRSVVTGHTPVPDPKWHHNVLAIDTGVAYVDEWEYGRLSTARIDGKQIETWSFER